MNASKEFTEEEVHLQIDNCNSDYKRRVLNETFPNATIGSLFTSHSPYELPTNFEYTLNTGNKIFLGTPFYYDDELRFIHYTSLANLMGIINENVIRLYSLDYLDDPNEFFIGQEMGLTVEELQKGNYYQFSFCKYNEKSFDEQFNQWRYYGRDGNGVGIIFTIDKANYDHGNYRLSKVFYGDSLNEGDSGIKLLKKFKELNETIQNENKYSVINSKQLFKDIYPFIKMRHYSDENEVRIVYYDQAIYNDRFDSWGYALNSRYEISTFKKISLFKNENHLPCIKIEKILMGYRFNEDDFKLISEKIRYFISFRLRESVSMEYSKFRNSFLRNL